MKTLIKGALLAMALTSVSFPANAGLFSDHANRKYLNELKAEMTELDTAYLKREISEEEHRIRKETLMFIAVKHNELSQRSKSSSSSSSSGMSILCRDAIAKGSSSGMMVHCN